MGAKQETKMIADAEGAEHAYTVTQLSATAALFLKIRVMKALAPGLDRLKAIIDVASKGEDASKADESQAVANILEGLQGILMELSPEEGVALIKQLLISPLVTRDRERIANLDLTYTGNLSEAYQAALFVLEVNYKDFFGVLGRLKRTSQASPEAEQQ